MAFHENQPETTRTRTEFRIGPDSIEAEGSSLQVFLHPFQTLTSSSQRVDILAESEPGVILTNGRVLRTVELDDA